MEKSDARVQNKKWDKKAFDIHSVKWVEDAYAQKKWAFCADYIRAYALFTEGGFYLDSDVIVNKNLIHFELWFCIFYGV